MRILPRPAFRIILCFLFFFLLISARAHLSMEDKKAMVWGVPVITGLSQDSAGLEGGEEVVITGFNFMPDSQVALGDAAANNVVVENSKRIRFRVPRQGLPGKRTLTVHTRAGIVQCVFGIVPRPLSQLVMGEITTLAGGLRAIGDSGNALDAALFYPHDLAFDKKGNLFIVDYYNTRIRRVDTKTGIITTVAGNGIYGYSGDGGPATSANLSGNISGIAFDSSGNLFIADLNNYSVRRVDAVTGIITTVAGNGKVGSGGNGVPATSISLYFPAGVAVDKANNLFFIDNGTLQIYKVDAATGTITIVAGSGRKGYDGDGGPAVNASFNSLNNLAIDREGNLFVADTGNYRVRRIDARTGIITTVAGNGEKKCSGDGGPAVEASLGWIYSFALDSAGNLLIGGLDSIRRVDAITGIIKKVVDAINLKGITADGAGNIFFTDRHVVKVKNLKTGAIDRVAGQNIYNGGNPHKFSDAAGPAIFADLCHPTDVAVDREGNLFIADSYNHRIRKVDARTGIMTTIAGGGSERSAGFSGDGGPAIKAKLNSPLSLAIDAAGNLFVADAGNNRVRKIDTKRGVITTVAGTGNQNNTPLGDGGPATSANIGFNNDRGGLFIDSMGNLFIGDGTNHRVRRVDAKTGIITTVAGNGNEKYTGDGGPATSAGLSPAGIALDTAGNLFIADNPNYRVRRVDAKTGIITTVMGNGKNSQRKDGVLATTQTVFFPRDLIVDRAGNLFIAPTGTEVRRIDAKTGVITTVAGGLPGKEPGIDGGPATKARLSTSGLALDAAGNLYIADSIYNTIRVVKEIAKH
jgi:trimeric autotransporter adhesin